jgi:hypothetical protein
MEDAFGELVHEFRVRLSELPRTKKGTEKFEADELASLSDNDCRRFLRARYQVALMNSRRMHAMRQNPVFFAPCRNYAPALNTAKELAFWFCLMCLSPACLQRR